MRFRLLSAVLVSLSAAVPLSAAPRTLVRINTPLYGMAPGEELVLRVVDVKRGATPARVSAVFVDGHNTVVGRVSGMLSPGEAFTFRLPQAALGSADSFPAVRALVILSLTGNGSGNQVLLNFEFFDVDAFRARGGGTCAQPHQGGPKFTCIGPIADVASP